MAQSLWKGLWKFLIEFNKDPTHDLEIPLLYILPREAKICPQKDQYANINSVSSPKRQKLETTQKSING